MAELRDLTGFELRLLLDDDQADPGAKTDAQRELARRGDILSPRPEGETRRGLIDTDGG